MKNFWHNEKRREVTYPLLPDLKDGLALQNKFPMSKLFFVLMGFGYL